MVNQTQVPALKLFTVAQRRKTNIAVLYERSADSGLSLCVSGTKLF